MKKQFWRRKKKKKRFQSMLNLEWTDIYEFDNAITFEHQSILRFWYLGNVLEKDETELQFQINIAWSLFIGLIRWRTLHLSHIWTIQLLSLNIKAYVRFIIYPISFCFFICWQLCWIKVCVLASRLHVFCFQSKVEVKSLRAGRVINFRIGGLSFWVVTFVEEVITPLHAMNKFHSLAQGLTAKQIWMLPTRLVSSIQKLVSFTLDNRAEKKNSINI